MKINQKKIFENTFISNLIAKKQKHRFPLLFQKLNLIKRLEKPKQKIEHLVEFKYNTESESIETNVSLIILISFSKVNTQLTFLNSRGSLLFSQSAGSVGLKSRQKINRKLGVKKLFIALKNSFEDLIKEKRCVALHLKNAGKELKYVTKTAEKIFIIQSLKSYDGVPFNGCRQKKMKRKKHAKPIIR